MNHCYRVLTLLWNLYKFGENSNAVSNELQREETHSRQLNSVANNSQLVVSLSNEGSDAMSGVDRRTYARRKLNVWHKPTRGWYLQLVHTRKIYSFFFIFVHTRATNIPYSFRLLNAHQQFYQYMHKFLFLFKLYYLQLMTLFLLLKI